MRDFGAAIVDFTTMFYIVLIGKEIWQECEIMVDLRFQETPFGKKGKQDSCNEIADGEGRRMLAYSYPPVFNYFYDGIKFFY